jgi:predicted Zn-dependent peptidase
MDIIAAELAAVAEDGITPAELERAKGHLRGALVLSSEDPGSRMNRLGRQQLGLGEIIPLDELIARFEALEIEHLKRVAKEILGAGSPHITVVGPFDEDAFGSHAA